MWALFVVVRPETVELLLELRQGPGRGSGPEPALQSLVETFDLALCLRVPRGPVLLLNTEDWKQVFERVAASAEPGGVNTPVIGQGARWGAVLSA